MYALLVGCHWLQLLKCPVACSSCWGFSDLLYWLWFSFRLVWDDHFCGGGGEEGFEGSLLTWVMTQSMEGEWGVGVCVCFQGVGVYRR